MHVNDYGIVTIGPYVHCQYEAIKQSLNGSFKNVHTAHFYINIAFFHTRQLIIRTKTVIDIVILHRTGCAFARFPYCLFSFLSHTYTLSNEAKVHFTHPRVTVAQIIAQRDPANQRTLPQTQDYSSPMMILSERRIEYRSTVCSGM